MSVDSGSSDARRGPARSMSDLSEHLREVADASEQWAGYGVRKLSMTHAELAKLLREAAEAVAERDRLIETRNSDYALLLDAWRERGERVPGADKQSVVQRVLTGIHELREERDKLREAWHCATALLVKAEAERDQWKEAARSASFDADERDALVARAEQAERELQQMTKLKDSWKRGLTDT